MRIEVGGGALNFRILPGCSSRMTLLAYENQLFSAQCCLPDAIAYVMWPCCLVCLSIQHFGGQIPMKYGKNIHCHQNATIRSHFPFDQHFTGSNRLTPAQSSVKNEDFRIIQWWWPWEGVFYCFIRELKLYYQHITGCWWDRLMTCWGCKSHTWGSRGPYWDLLDPGQCLAVPKLLPTKHQTSLACLWAERGGQTCL